MRRGTRAGHRAPPPQGRGCQGRPSPPKNDMFLRGSAKERSRATRSTARVSNKATGANLTRGSVRQCMYTLWRRGKGTGRRINSIMDRDNSSSPYRKTACGPAHRSPPASWQASPRSRHGPLPLALLLLLPPPLTPVRRMDVEMSGCVCSRRRQGQGMRGPGRGAWGRRTLVLYMVSLDDVSTTSEDVCVCENWNIV